MNYSGIRLFIICSFIAASGSYALTATAKPMFAVYVSVISVAFGLLAVLLTDASPKVKGGILSLIVLFMGTGAIIVAGLGVAGILVTWTT